MIKTKQIIILIVTLALLLTSCSTTLPQDLSKNEIFSDEESNLDVSKEAVEESDVSSDLSVNETSSDDVSDDDVMSDVSGEMELTETQKNSLAMLNYLTTISQEIDKRNNSKLFLEEANSLLYNNFNLAEINETTQERLNYLLRIINDYRVIAIKRERLQFLHNQEKATAMRKAMPNPLAILSIVESDGLGKLLTSMAFTIADSYENYKTHNDELGIQFLLSGWELDDDAAVVLHNNRVSMLNYMIDIVQQNDIPSVYALNDNSVERFAMYKVKNNVYQKIQFFESQKNIYRYFGSYWLELANCYFEIKEYEKCLECIEQYKALSIEIFRQDIEYAETLPKAIVSAQKIYSVDKYISIAGEYVSDVVNNAKEDDWSLRYFAAQVYVDLFSKTNEIQYLENAYEIILNNINELIKFQKQLNETYLADVIKQEIPDSVKYATEKEKKEEQKRLEAYNESLKEKRKSELVSLYEPLVLNCELLFALAEKIEDSDLEKSRIDKILKKELVEGMLMTNTSTPVFLSKPTRIKYSFFLNAEKPSSKYNKNEIIIPADLLIEDANITVKVKSVEGKETTFSDWKIKKVVRNGSDISNFEAYYYSSEIQSYKWALGDKITVTIANGQNFEPVIIEFEVIEYKDVFLFPDKVVFKLL